MQSTEEELVEKQKGKCVVMSNVNQYISSQATASKTSKIAARKPQQRTNVKDMANMVCNVYTTVVRIYTVLDVHLVSSIAGIKKKRHCSFNLFKRGMGGTIRLGLHKGASQEKNTHTYKYIAKLQQTNTYRTLYKNTEHNKHSHIHTPKQIT